MNIVRWAGCLGMGALLGLQACTPAPLTADGRAKQFYAGKTIRIISPFAPGGTSDVTARLFASRLGEYIPGKPTIIVENKPGGGGSTGMREVMGRSGKDGLTLVSVTGGVMLRWLFKDTGHEYPLDKMPAIGALPGGFVTVLRNDVAGDLEALLQRKEALKMGSTAPGGQAQLSEIMGLRLLGISHDQVLGFGGYGEVAIAVERGELQGASPGDLGYVQTWTPRVENKTIRPIFQSGMLDAKGAVVRSPIVSTIPTAYEEYKRLRGKAPSGDIWEAYRVLVGLSSVSTVLLMHPDAPADRVAVVRQALTKMVSDSSWKQETKRILGQVQPALNHEETTAVLKVVLNPPPSALELLKHAAKQASK